MPTESLLNDSEIIARTTTTEPDEKGRVAKEFTLDDGHIVRSAHATPESFSGKWWMTWTKDVRAVDEQRIADAEASAISARRKILEPYSDAPMEDAAPAESSSPVLPSTSSGELPDDPDQMIRDKLRRMSEENEDLLADITRKQERYAATAKNIDKWLAIAESLGVDLSEEESDGTDDTGQPDGGDGSVPADANAGDRKGGRRRPKRGVRHKRSPSKSGGGGPVRSPAAVEPPDVTEENADE